MSDSAKLAFLEKIFGKYRYHSNTHEAEFFSPFCSHHKPKLSINLVTDHWQDWISGKRGKRLLYPMKEAGASREELQEYINRYKPKGVTGLSARYDGDIVKITLPESYIALVNCSNSFVGQRAYFYLLSRGLSKLDILRYKIGVCTRGDHAGRIIFPSFSAKGELNFYTGRAYNGHYLNVVVPKGYKNSIILNELNIDWNKPIVITEGFVDVYKSVLNTVPLFNSFLHDESLLFETIVERAVEVILAFDKDAWKKQDNLCKKFSGYDVPVSEFQLTEDDLGQQTKEEGLALYKSRVSWSRQSSFLRRVRAL